MCRRVLVVGLALAAQLFAQTTPTTAPPGYESVEAASYNAWFGGRPAFRCQVMHGELKGKPGSFKRLSFRLDTFPTGSYPNGRSWSDVVLKMAEGPADFASTSETFTRNHFTAPTTVFTSNRVHWPQASAGYGMDPAPWGSPDGLAFPFSTTWIYSGKNGICADFDFHGGTLDNSSYWHLIESYFLDGVPDTVAGGDTYRIYGNIHCRATGRTGYSVYYPRTATYGLDALEYAGKFRYILEYKGLPASAASNGAFLAITTGGSTTGTPMPGSCNPLHVDLNRAAAIQLFLPDSSGTGAAPFATYQLFSYTSVLAGTDVWSQIAFEDGTPPRFQLTMAGRNRLWFLPNRQRSMLWSEGTVTGTRHSNGIPLLYLQ